MLEIGMQRGYARSWVIRNARAAGGAVPNWDYFLPLPEGYEPVMEGKVQEGDLIVENSKPHVFVPAKGAIGSGVDSWMAVLRKEE